MQPIVKGRYTVRLAAGPADLARAQDLRHLAFRARRGLGDRLDGDAYDRTCQHMLVEDHGAGNLVCCFRLLLLPAGGIGHSYAAQFYDLHRLQGFAGPTLELGRFCLHPDHPDPDILRLAWAALTRIVDAQGVGLLFGCSSFPGADASRHAQALALLAQAHLAPGRWRPAVKAPHIYPFATALQAIQPDARAALSAMPPLLRTYLMMGGWVSDHAVLDHDLDTLHVFTGVEIAAIPAARARALRALAG
ncbi:MAG: GNAT family N-acyltransferase [Pseudomonadota bacterium]